MRRSIHAAILALAASVMACVSSSSASAAAVLPASSGIKTQSYYVEWCSTHHSEVVSPSTVCRTGYFTKNIQAERGSGEVGVRQDGLGFLDVGGQAAQVNTNIAGGSSGRTGNSINNNPTGIPFFLSNNAQGFTLKGEGIYTIHLYSQDYAGNVSHSWVRYKVDKTAPNFEILGLSENSDYAHVSGDTYNVSTNVGRYDMWTQASTGNSYDVPRLDAASGECGNYCSSFTQAAPERRAIHNRSSQYGIYFRNTSDNAPFTVHTRSSDDYDGYLTSSSPVGSLVSGTRKVMLLASDGTPIVDNLSAGGNVGLNSSNLIANGLNSQKTYILRIYDNTYGRDGSQASGNYSEAAFRVMRDNTAPNMGGNGLAGTDASVAQRDMIKFGDDDSVYDSTIYSGGQYFSRFVGASNLVNLRYRVRDIGVTGDGTASGAGCTTYEYCNAGLSASEFYVERSDNPSATNKLFTLAGRFESVGDMNYDFSKVDNDLSGRNRYRYYSSNWRSPTGATAVCDLVGNCFTPSLTFRVVSAPVDAGQSTFALSAHSLSPEGKMLANGLNAYRISYTLKDRYGNLVTPVRSAENAGNPLVKSVSNTLAFTNGLYDNQLTNIPSGTKKAFVYDQEPDNITGQGGGFTENINAASSGSLTMSEAISTVASDPLPNGTYTLTFASRVPTVGMYPFLSDLARFSLDSVRIIATNSAAAAIQYPKTDAARLGLFDMTLPFVTSGSGYLVQANTGSISISGTSKSFAVDDASYGKIGIPNSNMTFATAAGQRMNFEFAPRALYSIKNMGMLTDGIFVGHDERVYKIDPTLTTTQYNVYQRPLVAYNTDKNETGIFDFRFRAAGITSDMNPGNRLTDFRPSDAVLGGLSPTYHNLDVLNTSGDGRHVEVQLLSKPGVTYDVTKTIRLGYVSALTYDVSGDTIRLPSYARDLSAADKSPLDSFAQARYYFSDSYTVNGGFIPTDPLDPTPSTGSGNAESVVGDIAIKGVINASSSNSITNDTAGTKGAVIMEEDLSRSQLIADLKRNVEIQSAGLAPASATTGKRWCDGRNTPFVIDQSFLDPSSLDQCTINVQGETISFIEGNARISCGGLNCTVNDPRTIIVKSGSIYVDANITTLGSTTGKLLLASLSNGALSSLTVDDSTTYSYTDANKQGWTFIDPDVTNIDAFVISQGPVVSYSDTMSDQHYYGRYTTEDTDLRNQLHIFGSLLALNNIGGSRQGPVQCPYIVLNCGEENSQVFDLIYLRRFTQVYKYKITGDPADIGVVPFYPNSWNTAKRSGGLVGENTSCSMSSGLRCISDADYQKTPLFVERDNRWDSSPSLLFRK